MLFALLDEIDFSEGAGIGHFFRLQIFRSEDKLLAVHQENPMAFGDGDHLLAFRDSHGQRLFADDVFAGRRAVPGHLRVQAVRGRNGHHLDVFFLEHLAVVGEHARNAESSGECGGVARRRGSYGNDLGLLRHDLQRCGVNIRLKLRSDDSDFDSAVCHAPLRSLCAQGFSAGPRGLTLTSRNHISEPSASRRILPLFSGTIREGLAGSGCWMSRAWFTILPFTRCVD